MNLLIYFLNWLGEKVLGFRESGAVRPVANLITGQAHRGSRESG
ncbi:hypothetical protein [Moorena sp. SIO4E2]|nr:hypothetical protein [Moorena sp. SIO4E2]